MKIRIRFTLLFVTIVGIILFFFSFSIYYISENYRKDDFYSRLKNRGITKFKLSILGQNETEIISSNHIEEYNFNFLENEGFIAFDTHKNILYQDGTIESNLNEKVFINFGKIIPTIKPNQSYRNVFNQIEYLGFSYLYEGNTYYIFISGFDKHGMSYIAHLKQTLFIRGFILLIIIFISGWLYAGRFLKPISNIIQQAGKITYSNMGQRLSTGSSNDEIDQLTTTFNKMLDRLETSFNSQKRFVSNASHELRNPLTAINGQIDVALMKERGKEEYKSTLQSISKDIKNLRTLTNNLLELANQDEILLQHFKEVRIDEILWSIREEIVKQNAEYTIHIHFKEFIENEKYLICKGDEKLLERAFVNIIDNACKFSNNKTVEVKILPDKSTITLLFIDTGIGISEPYLKHVFEPFYRGENTHGIIGNGIGLSLVRRIIKLHSGQIVIHSKLNQGTTVEVTIPNLSRF